MNELNGMTKMTMEDDNLKHFFPYSREDLALFCNTMSKMFDDKSIIHYLANIIVNGDMRNCFKEEKCDDKRRITHDDGLISHVNDRGYIKPVVKDGTAIIWFDESESPIYDSIFTGSEEMPYRSKSGLGFFDTFNFAPLQSMLVKGSINLEYDYQAKIAEYEKTNPSLYGFYHPLAESHLLAINLTETRNGPGVFGFAHKQQVFKVVFSPFLSELIKEAKSILAKEQGISDVSIGVKVDGDDDLVLKEGDEFVEDQDRTLKDFYVEHYQEIEVSQATGLIFVLAK